MSLKALGRGALAVAALATLGTAAHAQVAYTANTVTSVFYREFKKDGRFFVFNNPAAAAAFEQSGETGVGITRVGIGPNGETVFADNETALELFLFKYNVTTEVKRPTAPPLAVVWRDGKTRFTLGSAAYVEMSTRLQPRFTLEMPDDKVTLPGTAGPGDSKGSFRIRRAKFKLEGWFYRPSLEFEFQVNFTDVNNTPASQMVEDANIDWDISKKKRFRVKFGQFKAPFGRQQLTSSGAQQFVDRAIQDARYNDARETGISLWGTLGGNKLDWRAMMSNGNGRTQTLNDNNKYLWTGRLMWQAIGNTRMDQWGSGALLTEGDLGDSAAANGPLLAVAGQISNNDRFGATTAVDLNNQTWAVDYTFKYRGFASVGEYADRRTKSETPATGAATPEFHDKGFLVQASYAFKAPGIPGASFWELAFRYAQVDPNDNVSGNDRTEVGGAISYYYNKHSLKVQADYRQLKDDAGNSGAGRTDNEFRLQTQLVF
jgi:phosphate-selective porin OprO/OprP